ncbi:major facilitator superfamily domain-containing protein [Mrakia frigida]|uniref:major facilitator superfamily domain-containing protein n=1 Tax=Mrakia frigida TaxID=29902 RepID=UPI003FCC1F4C
MKEALGLYGNELNYLDTLYRIGYALFLIPSQIILLKIRPSIWLPALELCWGVLTGLMAVASNVKGMYALRFFIGVCEASSYPGIICILCNWYTPAELASRIAIFGTSYPAANIFVSFMQAALYKGMEGHAGLPGWKWLFIFNALMTVIVAAGGFFFLPDNPGETKVFWLSPEQNSLSRARMVRVKKLAPTVLSVSKIKKIFSSWIIYAFTGAYACWSWSQNSNSYTILFFKSIKNSNGTAKFSIPTLNAIMIPGYFLQIIAMIACGWASGKWGSRIGWIVGQEMTLFVGAVILSCWPASFGLKTFAYFTLWLSNAAGPILIVRSRSSFHPSSRSRLPLFSSSS